jgi:hypothetical protein
MIDRKRFRIAIGVSVVLVVAVVASVLAFGVIPTPKFKTITEAPLPGLTGQIAYLSSVSDEDSHVCADVLNVMTGVEKTLGCNFGAESQLTWLTDGRLAVEDVDYSISDTSTANVSIYNVATGTVDTTFRAPSTIGGVSGALTSTEVETGDGASLTDPNGKTLVKVRAPRDYSFDSVEASPDGKFLLIEDSNNRLLVATQDGKNIRQLHAESNNYYDLTSANPWYQSGQTANTQTLEELKSTALWLHEALDKAECGFCNFLPAVINR